MKQNETIVDMYSRFQTIQHDLMALGVKFTNFDLVSRILNSLTSDWERKVLAVEEAKDLSTLKVEELIGNLISYEANLEAQKELNSKKKNTKVTLTKILIFRKFQHFLISLKILKI